MNDNEIRARCDAATPGDWESTELGDIFSKRGCFIGSIQNGDDIDFITHSRTDIPFLLDRCVALLTDNERLTNLLQNNYCKLVLAEEGAKLLAAELDKLREAERWIPVTERLPEDNQLIVGYHEAGYVDSHIWANPWDVLDDVTHWRPLPQSPQETMKQEG